MSYREHREQSPQNLGCAVITVSDSRTEQTDKSGDFIKKRLAESGHKVTGYALLKNEPATIRKTISEFLEKPETQVIITTGGTGLSRRDVTVETVSPMLEKKLDGFGELFRSLSYEEIGTAAILSRAVGGVIKCKVILCLPGSLGAVTTAMERVILPEVRHMVREATR